ncbi:phosphate/phosphite/phosphonate ABC transporter substrate-binding protein [Zavarzinella formosa]|uniref:phosphate/phosphite/phosphonate ABC transporter substrate-binding protein n=1 Tax=Zavarzinella formosa TaxID=360055 RepID=UPI0002F03ED5|nr:PhnD/SsuA/transferrin family substrate-binding protein [Zavarzinella formosa]
MKRTCLTSLTCCFFLVAGVRAEEKPVVKIGIPRSIFRDIPPALLTFANEPFKDLMKAQTGLDGDIVNDADAMKIAKDINDGKLHLGVLLGHEFAWAKQKYPELEAIVCTVPRPREVQAFILVRHDCKATNLGDLKGTKLVMASGLRDHARLFFEKRKADEMGSETLCSLSKTSTVHDAIHKVIDGDGDVTVCDLASWNYFLKLYPGPAQNLRVLAKSEVFPPSVVVHKKGSIPEFVVKKFREGMLTAHQSPKGQKLMGTIKMERFDLLPANYDEQLKESLKLYPLSAQERAMIDK